MTAAVREATERRHLGDEIATLSFRLLDERRQLRHELNSLKAELLGVGSDADDDAAAPRRARLREELGIELREVAARYRHRAGEFRKRKRRTLAEWPIIAKAACRCGGRCRTAKAASRREVVRSFNPSAGDRIVCSEKHGRRICEIVHAADSKWALERHADCVSGRCDYCRRG